MFSIVILFFSVLFLLFLPFGTLITSGVGIVFNRKYAKLYLFFFVLVISLPILRYSPAYGDDSSWHYFAASEFSKFGSFSDLMEWLYDGHSNVGRYNYKEIPIFTYIMYFFSDTFTYSLISFVVCIITYYCYTVTIVDLYQENHILKRYLLVGLIAIILANNYRYTTSGMRYCLSMSLMMMVLYFDAKIEKGKIGSIFFSIFYLIPFLVHPAVIYFICIRFAYPFINKIKWYSTLLLLLAFPVLAYLVPCLADLLGHEMLLMYASKIEAYLSNDAYAELFIFTIMARMYIGTLVIFLYLFLFLFLKKNIDNENILFRLFIVLTLYFSIFSLGTVFARNIFDRNLFIVYPMIVLSTTILITRINSFVDNLNNRNFLYFTCGCIYFLCIFIGFFYNKNFPLDYIDYSVSDIFTKNIFEYFSNLPRFYLNTN